MAARSTTLEDSARELAHKIAAALPARQDISCEIRNVSSLQPGEIARIEQTLKSELQSQCVFASARDGAIAGLVVTLSENLKSLVWTAEIHQGDASQVVLTMIPRPLDNQAFSSGMPMTLRSERFWEGLPRLLDAMIVKGSNGEALLLLLTPDGLQIRKVGSEGESIVQIPHAESVTRDPSGAIAQTENGITVRSMTQSCSIDSDAGRLIECHPNENPQPAFAREYKGIERGSQIIAVQSTCRDGHLYLAAGHGDYTEPDTIQLFESKIMSGILVERPLSGLLHFAGPVMALQSGGDTPRAIVRDLQTGNYEAYRISISCGQ